MPQRVMALMDAICERERDRNDGKAAVSSLITISAQMALRHNRRDRRLLALHMREELVALEASLDEDD